MNAFGLVMSAVSTVFPPIEDDDTAPAGSIAHFGFASDYYWTQADGVLSAADIVTDPSVIVPGVGYVGAVGANESVGMPIIGPALALFSTNMTLVLKGRIEVDTDATISAGYAVLDLANDTDYVEGVTFGLALLGEIPETPLTVAGRLDWYTADNYLNVAGTARAATRGEIYRFDTAYTQTASRTKLSTLGNPVEGNDTGVTIAAFGVVALFPADFIVGVTLALESITIYPPVADADLPALSSVS